MRKGFALTIALLLLLSGVGYGIYQMDDIVAMTTDGDYVAFDMDLLKDEKTYRNTNYQKDYIEIDILGKNKIVVKGKTIRNYDSFMVDIFKKDVEKELFRDEGSLKNGSMNFSKTYELGDGYYDLKVYYGNKTTTSDGWFTNYQGEVETTFKVKNKDFTFPKTDVYYKNLEQLSKNNNVKKRHKSLLLFSSQEQLLLKDLVKNIVGDSQSDYEKAFLIADWVSKNIYYDFDALKKGKYDVRKAIDTLNARRSVCQGYADLTQALMRAADLPARKTIGYGLGGSGVENESWDDIGPDQANHVWNEVFIDGRWVIIDTTWNSTNKYENGQFKKEQNIYAYFDMTLEAFADKHRITER